MNKNPAEIGERIKAARKAAGLSQTELANRLSKTLRTVQKYESGEIEPSLAVINSIARQLRVSPADLIGYQRPSIELNSISDVLTVLYQLNKKAGLRFEIDVKRPPHYDEWTCSLRFDGHNKDAEFNADLCLILEDFNYERQRVETYMSDVETFDAWVERKLASYADTRLVDREVEILSNAERIKRMIALDRQMLEQKKKAAEDNGSQD